MTNIQRYTAADLPELMEKIHKNSIGWDDYFESFWNTNTNANYPPYNICLLYTSDAADDP